jgi:hypothetical protein
LDTPVYPGIIVNATYESGMKAAYSPSAREVKRGAAAQGVTENNGDVKVRSTGTTQTLLETKL